MREKEREMRKIYICTYEKTKWRERERGKEQRRIKGGEFKREHERERNTLADDEGSIGWLAVSGWVPKLKSFGGIRERDVESSTGVRAVAGAG